MKVPVAESICEKRFSCSLWARNCQNSHLGWVSSMENLGEYLLLVELREELSCLIMDHEVDIFLAILLHILNQDKRDWVTLLH